MANEERPIVTVDVALFTLMDGRLHVGLLRREREPFRGALALPGGFVHIDEDDDAAATARRVIREKAGLSVAYLEQLFTFSGRFRDPRDWSLSVAYYAIVPQRDLAGGASYVLVPVDEVPELPFDHNRIVRAAVDRLRAKATYSSLPAFLLAQPFTLPELQTVYEQTIGTRLERTKFRRTILAQGFIEPTDDKKITGANRPAQLYQLRSAALAQFNTTI